jgi:flagella basal body P-ring formation protein FlgA
LVRVKNPLLRSLRGLVGLIGASLAALAALLASGGARAELPADAVARALALARHAAQSLAPAGSRVLASPGALDARLRLEPCTQVEPYLIGGQPAWGRTRVGMRCAAGAAWKVTLPVQVLVLAPAFAPRVALPAGARVVEEQFERVEADWAAAASPPVTDPSALAGRTLARPLAAGQALRAADLQPRRWFASGEPVQVLAQGRGYTISIQAQALSHGLEGQVVRVRTDNGRILTGRAVGESRVEVAL